MRSGEIEILFIASKNINPVEILEKTWSCLCLSSTVVIYCPIAEVNKFFNSSWKCEKLQGIGGSLRPV